MRPLNGLDQYKYTRVDGKYVILYRSRHWLLGIIWERLGDRYVYDNEWDARQAVRRLHDTRGGE